MSITRSVAATESPPSVEQVRKQAKRRLMGVSVLVLAAVVVFPLLFDTQPRPVPVDMPIEIPSRKVSKPLQVDSPAVVEQSPAQAISEPAAPDNRKGGPVVTGKPEPEEVIIESTPRKPTATAEAKPEAKPVAPAVAAVAPAVVKAMAQADTPEKKPSPPPAKPVSEKTAPEKSVAEKPAASPPAPSAAPAVSTQRKDLEADAARAQALLEGKVPPAATPAPADAATARFIVQVGAFADGAVAQATREKLERAGLKTYTHVAQLPEGKRTRVRLGPFTTKADAEKAAAKAKAQGLPAAILTL